MSMPPASFESWGAMLRVPRILWAALMFSCVIYGGLVAGELVAPAAVTSDPTMVLAFAAAAIGSAVASFVIPATMLRQGFGRLELAVEEREDPAAATLFRDAPPRVRFVADPVAARSAVYGRFFAPFILSLALSESVAIFGLVGAMSGFFTIPIALAFVGAALVLQAVRFPTSARLVALVEKHTGARWPSEDT